VWLPRGEPSYELRRHIPKCKQSNMRLRTLLEEKEQFIALAQLEIGRLRAGAFIPIRQSTYIINLFRVIPICKQEPRPAGITKQDCSNKEEEITADMREGRFRRHVPMRLLYCAVRYPRSSCRSCGMQFPEICFQNLPADNLSRVGVGS
jgi:hypothetical protein